MKAYPGVTALEPVTIEVEHGETVAIVGPSGSGKTTLLFLLGGVIQPTAGSVRVNGLDPSSLGSGRQLARLVGVIPQQSDLVLNMQAVHNVLAGRLGEWSFARSFFSLISPREREKALEALRKVGIADKLNARTSHLSGGEQQRLAIARVLVQDPQAILADEPVASLDPTRAEDLVRLLTGLTKESGKTLVASLHSVHLARAHFSRIIGLRNGALQFDLPAGQVNDGLLERLYALQGLRGETPTPLS